jgi:hypothetical protein
MDCGVQIRKIVRVCETVTALLMKTDVWDVTLFRRGVMPISPGSSLSSTLLGLLYLEDGGTSLLRNGSWHGQTSRQTVVLRMATV